MTIYLELPRGCKQAEMGWPTEYTSMSSKVKFFAQRFWGFWCFANMKCFDSEMRQGNRWHANRIQIKHAKDRINLAGYGSIPINTIFNGMNIYLPAILGFTRYQGFDPSPACFLRVKEPEMALLSPQGAANHCPATL